MFHPYLAWISTDTPNPDTSPMLLFLSSWKTSNSKGSQSLLYRENKAGRTWKSSHGPAVRSSKWTLYMVIESTYWLLLQGSIANPSLTSSSHGYAVFSAGLHDGRCWWCCESLSSKALLMACWYDNIILSLYSVLDHNGWPWWQPLSVRFLAWAWSFDGDQQ